MKKAPLKGAFFIFPKLSSDDRLGFPMSRAICINPPTTNVLKEANMIVIPDIGYLRLTQIIGNPRAVPPIPALVPIARSTLWEWVRSGKFPAPVKLSARVTVWRAEDVRSFLLAER